MKTDVEYLLDRAERSAKEGRIGDAFDALERVIDHQTRVMEGMTERALRAVDELEAMRKLRNERHP